MGEHVHRWPCAGRTVDELRGREYGITVAENKRLLTDVLETHETHGDKHEGHKGHFRNTLRHVEKFLASHCVVSYCSRHRHLTTSRCDDDAYFQTHV